MLKLKLRKIMLYLFDLSRPLSAILPSKIKQYIRGHFVNPLIFNNEFIFASYGDLNPDKTILIIGGHNAGLYSIIHNVVGYLIYAEEKGYIPVVDYKNNKTFYHDETFNGNLWEEYFDQPSNYSLDEVYSSKNVVHSPIVFSQQFYPRNGLHILNDNEKIVEIYNIFDRYIHYNTNTIEYINEVYSEIKGKELLGLYLRGTDYKSAKGHAIQPKISLIFDKIDYFLSKYSEIKGIFVSTEEEETLLVIIERYGEIVYYQKRPRIKDFQEGKLAPNISFDGVNDKIRIGREYITDIEILSKLNYFLCGLSNGSAAVIEKNGLKFKEYQVLFEGFNK